MPAAPSAAAAAKRKRSAKTSVPRKRTCPEHDSDSDDDASAQDRILLLESQITESKKHLNNIVALLDIARRDGPADGAAEDGSDDEDNQTPALTAAVALCRVFLRLLAAGSLAMSRGISDKDAVVVRWLRDRLAEYEKVLAGLFSRSADAASTALTLSMRLLQAQGEARRRKTDGGHGAAAEDDNSASAYAFPQQQLNATVRSLVLAWAALGSEAAESLVDSFVETYVGAYSDVQFYTFKAVPVVLDEVDGSAAEKAGKAEDAASAAAAANGALYLLSRLDDVPTTSDEFETFFVNPPPPKRSHALYSVAKHRRQAQTAWLAVLQRAAAAATPGHKALRKRALGLASTVIAPWFAQPELMLDFLTDCYDAGGSTSLLALSGLYYLIRERNVDYAAFYPKLYSLLDAELLHSKHRSRFFRLLDTFLASTHLPAQLVASFIKRLARLCLNAPPSAVVTVVPWIYNMLKSHPLCTFMIHRVPRTPEARAALARDGLADPFLAEEADPMATQAIDSCLWEVVQLQSHYHPNVATIAKIISEQFTKHAYNVEDFLDHSYQSMLEAEMGKEVRKAPVVEFQIPKRIFLPHDPASGVEDKLLVKLWDFA